jgi:hypothetical protein
VPALAFSERALGVAAVEGSPELIAEVELSAMRSKMSIAGSTAVWPP